MQLTLHLMILVVIRCLSLKYENGFYAWRWVMNSNDFFYSALVALYKNIKKIIAKMEDFLHILYNATK